MKKITNTERGMNGQTEAIAFLGIAMALGGSNAIELQEASGQRELAASAQLPTKGLNDPAFAMIKVHGQTEGDPLFSDVTLPDGWRKQRTDHSMWSDLLDEKGRKRAGIFYKAAFYDRGAHISPNRRYYSAKDYDYKTASRFIVKDNATGDVLFVSAESPDPFPQETISREESFRRSDLEGPNKAAALDWINEHFPNWNDASAYWD